jgi:hypothetical protein
MVSFTFSVQESPFSSEILSTPSARKWWPLVGEAVFREGSGEVMRRSSVIAYRDRGEWYFSPQNIDDDAWARTHLTREEIDVDRAGKVQLKLARGCPLEIVDLHVHVNRNSLNSRHIEFRLRNKSGQRITGYTYEIGDERREGSINVGTGAPHDSVKPNGLSNKLEQDHVAYLYWCQGESRIYIEIQNVTFADGSVWAAPGFLGGR